MLNILFLVAVLSSARTVLTQSKQECPENIRSLSHVHVTTDTCILFNQEKVTWSVARSRCQSLNGDLVMLKDSSKHYEFSVALNAEAAYIEEQVWIGATDVAVEGEWRWIDGSLMQYHHFANDEGLNHVHRGGFFFNGDTHNQQDCGLVTKSDGNWRDYPCNSIWHFQFACEFPRKHATTTVSNQFLIPVTPAFG